MSLSKVSGIQHLANWAGHFFIIQVYHQPQAVVSLGSKKMHMVSRITQMGVNLWHKSQWKCFKNIPCSTSTPLAAKGCWHKTDWVGELMLLMQSSDPAYPASEKKKKKDVLLEMAAYFFQSCRVQFCELFLTADLNVLFLAEWVEWRCTVERQAENLFKGLTQCCDMFCSLLKCVDFDCLSFFLSEVTNRLQILLYLTGLDCYVLVHN